MGGTGQIHDNRRAGGVTPQCHGQRAPIFERFTFDNPTHAHHHLLGVGYFNADIGAPRHRRFNTHRRHRQRQRQIIGQTDNFVDPHLAPLTSPFQVKRLYAKLGHGRSTLDMHDAHRHIKIFQGILNQGLRFSRTYFPVDTNVCNQQIKGRQARGRGRFTRLAILRRRGLS